MTLRYIIFAAILWASFAGIFYSYALYAVVIRVCATLLGKVRQPPEPAEDQLPAVSLLIAAYNEAEVIEQRILNALELDYPAERLQIAIASDGSSDDTARLVRKYADRGVRLFDYPINRGKATVLNDSIPKLTGQIIVLSDANTFFEKSAIRSLARWFEIESVGAVCGRLVLTDPKTGKNADGLYWKYETFLKIAEDRLGALLGSNGAIYAVRRDRYVPIPPQTIVDDFVIPLLAKLRFGCSVIYDKQAVAHEQTPADLSSEFNRRVRIGAGGYQSIPLLWRLLDPRRGWIALSFFSHKILRWLCPLFMAMMIVANIALLDHPIYRGIFVLQVLFYLSALVAGMLPAGSKLSKPLRLASMFVSMNAALAIGFFRWLGGGQRGAWKRTSRAAEQMQTRPAV